MFYKFNLFGLDCPNCASKIEKEISGLAYVSHAEVNLFLQTIEIETDEQNENKLCNDICKIVKIYEPDANVSALNEFPINKDANIPKNTIIEGRVSSEAKLEHNHSHGCLHVHVHNHDHLSCEHGNHTNNQIKTNASKFSPDKIMIIRIAIGCVIYASGLFLRRVVFPYSPLIFFIFLIAYLVLGYDIVLTALRNLTARKIFDENFLMSVSTIGAFIINEYPEAVAVMLFYQIGEFCQDKAVDKSRKTISGLMKIRPDMANLKKNGEIISVHADVVKKDDEIIVKPGERVPLDGVVISGNSSLDTMAITGESLPKDVLEGDPVYSGSINMNGVLNIRVLRSFKDSTASRIIEMVANASSKKAPTEKLITKFAAVYTPIVVFMAFALALLPPLLTDMNLSVSVHRALVFLVISCPCAFVVSVPLAFFGGIGAAAKKGILVKGGNYLEILNKVKTIVFDKTGTLTKGIFKVSHVELDAASDKNELLKIAACAEFNSNHPIAESIVKAYGKTPDTDNVENYEEIPGYGVKADYNGKKLLAGSEKLMEKNSVKYCRNTYAGTKVYVALEERCLGCIVISDEVKADSKNTVKLLKSLGMERIVMLTGDGKDIAQNVADKIGIEEYHANLLPLEKVKKVENIMSSQSSGNKVAFVGDGINDAPVLARADIGISMGALGSDAAIDAADVVLMTDEPIKIVDAIKTASKTKSIALQNIFFALLVKIAFMILGSFGIAGMWEAVFADVGVTLIAVLNSMRMLNFN